jgi:hypothetical protein
MAYYFSMRAKTPPLLHGPKEKLRRSEPMQVKPEIETQTLYYLGDCSKEDLGLIREALTEFCLASRGGCYSVFPDPPSFQSAINTYLSFCRKNHCRKNNTAFPALKDHVLAGSVCLEMSAVAEVSVRELYSLKIRERLSAIRELIETIESNIQVGDYR